MATAGTKSAPQTDAPQTDVFMTHDWGEDEKGRKNHDRVAVINKRLRDLGYRTWFDEDYIHTDIQDAMCDGIDQTRLVLVHLTTRYMDKVNSKNQADNCRQEFLYSFNLQKKILCITMDPTMSKSSNWVGVLRMTLGNSLFVRFDGDFDNEEYLNKQINLLVKQLNLKGIKPLVPKKYCPQCNIHTDAKKFCDECGAKLQDARVGESEVVAVAETEGPNRVSNTSTTDAKPEKVQQKVDALEIKCESEVVAVAETEGPNRVTDTSATSDPKPEKVEQVLDVLEIKCKVGDDSKEEMQVPERSDNEKKILAEYDSSSDKYDYVRGLIKKGDVKTVRTLIEDRKELLKLSDVYKWTPYLNAAYYGSVEMLQMLYDMGADVDVVNVRKTTALHLACSNTHEVVKWVFEKTPQFINVKGKWDQTPLHEASYSSSSHSVRYLLDHGGDVTMKDNEGYTPLGWARKNKKTENAAVLENWMKEQGLEIK